MQKKALGRGLDALIGGGFTAPVAVQTHPIPAPAKPLGSPATGSGPAGGIQHLDITAIEPNRYQPRREFDPEHLKELADSIRQRGVMQPLLVRTGAPGRYELIAGERRWRAAKTAGLTTVPAIIRQATDAEALEIALIENIQREDLNPIEEAKAYEQLATVFLLTQEQIADKVGRSRAGVANALRLLTLPGEVLSWVANGQLSVGHAKVILGLNNGEEQRLVAERCLKRNLTVRDTEMLVEGLKGDAKARARVLTGTTKAADIVAVEEALQQKLGTQVSVRHGKKKGRIEIVYYGNDDLARLLAIFGVDNL
ncbi:MAG: Stage 0 sporulation protein J [Verrucomicrobiae bacterium]|nr:Stage 0 sporulation protein J [Verrucomicrobiae bacterium]